MKMKGNTLKSELGLSLDGLAPDGPQRHRHGRAALAHRRQVALQELARVVRGLVCARQQRRDQEQRQQKQLWSSAPQHSSAATAEQLGMGGRLHLARILPVHFGGRFSANARGPSAKSSDRAFTRPAAAEISHAVASSTRAPSRAATAASVTA